MVGSSWRLFWFSVVGIVVFVTLRVLAAIMVGDVVLVIA